MGHTNFPPAFSCKMSDTFLKMLSLPDIDLIIDTHTKHYLNRLVLSTFVNDVSFGSGAIIRRQTFARGPLTKRAKEGRRRSRLCPRRQSSPNRTPICRARSCFVIGLRLKFNFGCLGIGKITQYSFQETRLRIRGRGGGGEEGQFWHQRAIPYLKCAAAA